MAGIPFRTTGTLFSDDQQSALLLSAGGRRHTLRLGFVLRGTEETLLPETLLDDWGHEIGGLDLYLWIKENGTHFPRAEIFGLDLSGRPRQFFIRELELAARYPCLVYENPSGDALTEGVRLTEILVPHFDGGHQRLGEAPAEISFPLRHAAVEWWAVDRAAAQHPGYDFYGLTQKDERT